MRGPVLYEPPNNQSARAQNQQHTDSALEEVRERIAGILPRYGLGQDCESSLLNVSENATFLIAERATGRRFVMRFHRVGYHTRRGVESELAWLSALNRDKIAEVAKPIADARGAFVQNVPSRRGAHDRLVVMFTYLEGQEPSPDGELTPWFQTLGALTARLHRHAKSWRRPNGFERQVWDFNAMLGERHLWGPWQSAVGLTSDGRSLLARAAARIASQLAEYGQEPHRFGLIHADLRLANLLIDGARLKLLDFDDSGFSWFMYDFASAISFYEHLPNVPALREAWLEGYGSLEAVSSEDRNIIPDLVMARRCLLLAWIASHGEVPIARQLGAEYTEQSLEMAERYLRGRLLLG
jgi:Ser/Thr protein kinase RdoA (MazF antagonist)